MPPSPTPCTLKGGSLFGMEGTLCYAACLPPRTTATQAATVSLPPELPVTMVTRLHASHVSVAA